MKVGLIICSYNRASYLSQCLASVVAADLSKVDVVMIIDDASTDPQTRRLIDDFDLENVELIKCYSKENRSIKGSLLFGLDLLFNSCDLVTNLDGDAIIAKDAFNRLIDYKKRFGAYIVTGFNCTTKNKDGSIRHKIISEWDDYNMKASVGGINMIFDKNQYLQIVRPALQKSIKEHLNWDHQACITSMTGFGKEIVCMTPSCVQHIGTEISSMGHSAGGEPPDTAEDFPKDVQKLYAAMVWTPTGEHIPLSDLRKPLDEIKRKHFDEPFKGRMNSVKLAEESLRASKLQLPNVTLICADGVDVERCIHAANISCRDIEFGAVKILSHLPSDDTRVIAIRPLVDKKDYSQFILKEIVNYVDTEFMLIFQYDGFVLNASAWMPQFMMYDMVGAAWKFRPEKRTANGGFSLRSTRMMQAISFDDAIQLKNDHIISNYAEDHVLFYIYREYLEEKYKINIAPENFCDRFSIEAWGEKFPNNKYNGSFGFHGFSVDFNEADLPYVPYKLPNRQIL